jgi:hypothetical protein
MPFLLLEIAKAFTLTVSKGPYMFADTSRPLPAGNFLNTAVECVNIVAFVICKNSLTGEKLE